ncbi:MAG: polysaccharide deacetylase family protein [Bacteroidota bacterium]|jgi:peptidoglycan/xylan/chitin deacetylase (PgdA/CDA1 family)
MNELQERTETRETTNIKVLMYHRVVENPDDIVDYWHAVHAENFRQQLRLLERFNFTPITFEDYHLAQRGELTLPKKPIIITFDDGHLDTYEIAAPILEGFGMRAVIFAMGNRSLDHAYWDQGKATIYFPLMADHHLRELRQAGFEIGAHSMNHRILPNLSLDQCTEEVQGSKDEIEQVLGEKIISFSYPYGRLDNRVRAVVREAGFEFACGVYSGPARFGEDRFDYRRLAINNDIGLTSFMLRVLTPYEYAEWAYNRMKTNGEGQTEDEESALSEELMRRTKRNLQIS